MINCTQLIITSHPDCCLSIKSQPRSCCVCFRQRHMHASGVVLQPVRQDRSLLIQRGNPWVYHSTHLRQIQDGVGRTQYENDEMMSRQSLYGLCVSLTSSLGGSQTLQSNPRDQSSMQQHPRQTIASLICDLLTAWKRCWAPSSVWAKVAMAPKQEASLRMNLSMTAVITPHNVRGSTFSKLTAWFEQHTFLP